MPFPLDRFSTLRPYLFHLTAGGNVDQIRESAVLKPARTLYCEGGRADRVPVRRIKHEVIKINGGIVWVRDQSPLHSGAIDFEDGWNIARLVGTSINTSSSGPAASRGLFNQV
jgi:hypothetical protein